MAAGCILGSICGNLWSKPEVPSFNRSVKGFGKFGASTCDTTDYKTSLVMVLGLT